MDRGLPGVHYLDDQENRNAAVSSATASIAIATSATQAIRSTAPSESSILVSSAVPYTSPSVMPYTPPSAMPYTPPSAMQPVITAGLPRPTATEPKPTQILRQPVISVVSSTVSVPQQIKVEEQGEASISGGASASSAGQSLIDFLEKVDNYKPTIPESIVQYHMQSAGLSTSDPRVTQLIALASQKFISDIVNDTFHFSQTQRIKKSSDKKPTLTLDVLAPVLGEYGFNVKKPTYMQ